MIDDLNEKIRETDKTHIVAVMTLTMLILFMQNNQFLQGILLLMVPAGFLFKSVAKSKVYWSVLAVFVAVGFIHNYHFADNHIFLTVYWTIAVALSFWAIEPQRNISFNAKMLIGLCFAFATFWKLTSPEFLEGTFFDFTTLTDRRFEEFAKIVGGVGPEIQAANRELYWEITDFTSRTDAVTLNSTPILKKIAVFMGYWTVFIEGWIAISFLAPRKTKVAKWRDLPLILFMISTYPIATVRGFATLLAIMGFAQCGSENRHMRLVYLAVFIGIPLFSLPFGEVLSRILALF